MQKKNEEITKLISGQKEDGYKVITDGEFRGRYWRLNFMWGFNGIKEVEPDHGYYFHCEFLSGRIYLKHKIACALPEE